MRRDAPGVVVWLTAIVALMTACGNGTRDVTSSELNLYTWTEYVPDSVIEGFEEEFDVTVNVEYYASNEEAIRGIGESPGRYDLVIPSDYAVEILIARDLLEPIDPNADIENFGNIDPSFRTPFFDPGGTLQSERGKGPEPKYSIPYQWGTTGITFDTTAVSRPPDSWDDVADPGLVGRVALIDDARDVLGAGLIATGGNKNAPTEETMAAAAEWVRSLDAVPVNVDQPEQPLIDGEAVIGIMYNGNAAEAIRANPDFEYVLPVDGSIWFDNLAIPVDAPHRDAALAFIDYVLRPEVGAEITRFFGYSTPNQASLELLVAEGDPAVDNVATNPPADSLLDLLLTKDVGEDGTALYEETWEEVRP
jgi:spermidine/putrescine-binding protein